RLGERRVRGRYVARDLVDQGSGRIDHVRGHRTRGPTLEAVDVVRSAHVVVAGAAVAAGPARHDMFGDHPVADRDPPPGRRRVVQLDDLAGELMTGNDRGLDVSGAAAVSPEFRRAMVAL